MQSLLQHSPANVAPLAGAAGEQTILIYADPLLSPTMTFVRAQGLALRSFSPLFAGPQRIRNGLSLPEGRVIALHEARGGLGRLAKLKEVPLKVFGHAPLFFRRVKRFDPVLIHAHFGPAALTALPLARWLKVPMIVTYHGYDATAADEHLRRANYRSRVYTRRKGELWNAVEVFIAVSEFIRSRLLQQGFPEEKIVVHYIGVDTEAFAPDPQVLREPIVLFVASLHEGKGCEYVIRAMAKLQSELPEAELVVIGDGPLRKSLEEMARKSLRRYKFLGIQSPEVVRQWMNRAKVFSVASVPAGSGWMEAFGLVYTEAQAMGLPVVSFASGGVPEAIADGETGFLAPERDTEALAYHLQRLLRDDAMCTRMGEAARKRVCAQFNLRIQTRRLEELYTDVLERTAKQPRSTKRHGRRT
jgi:colanic acid/amylovoran biosynthesis glycosyltransferase